MVSRLLEKHRDEVIPALKKQLGRDNVHSIPELKKIVISMGVGSAIQDAKLLDEAVKHLTTISGQKPQVTRSRIAVSGFRLRQGVPIGCRVTLRRKRMYEFLDRLISVGLPRVRDFRGLNPKSFDGNGNYSLGLTEQMIFPEINPDKVKNVQGMNITIVTSANTNEEAFLLLKELGMPFKRETN